MAENVKNKAGRISAEELSSFCDEVAMMLSSGMQLYDGMEALAETYADTSHADLYRQVSDGMAQTGSLYDALKADSRWPSHLVEMAGVGERSGRLEEVMRGLARYYDRESRIRSAVTSAVTYPLVLGIMLVLIVLIMIVMVLPVFRRVLSSMGVVMTSSGAAMMNAGTTVGWVVLALVLAVVLFVTTIAILTRTSARQKVLNWLGQVFPPIRRLSSKLAASRVFSVLSMMLTSGFPLEEGLNMVPPVLSDMQAIDKVQTIQKDMEQNKSFADALLDAKLADEVHSRMIRLAVNAGQEDEVMAKIAGIYEEQVEEGVSNLVSIIEPTLVALLCVVIGAILLSVILPMAGIISSIL